MGCTASAEKTGVERTTCAEPCDDGEMVRTVSEAAMPVRVSSRKLTQDEVLDQRARARASVGSEISGHVVLESETNRSSFRRVGSRISTLKPAAQQQLILGLGDMAATGEGSRHGLEGRLRACGMKMKEMEGDGNCQFRTLAFNLFGEQAHHAVTRKAAVAHMKKHQDFFGVLFESADEFRAYLKDMSRNRTWGDELTLRAVVEAYGCEAHVITSEPANWYLVYQPEIPDGPDPKIAACPRGVPLPKPGKRVFLSYISPVHYNSVVMARSKE